jgi:hypothetical protein
MLFLYIHVHTSIQLHTYILSYIKYISYIYTCSVTQNTLCYIHTLNYNNKESSIHERANALLGMSCDRNKGIYAQK